MRVAFVRTCFLSASILSQNRCLSAISSSTNGIRLNKALGVKNISRREGDKIIASGRVTVNSIPAEAGQKVVPFRDIIKLDGKVVKGWEASVSKLNGIPKGAAVKGKSRGSSDVNKPRENSSYQLPSPSKNIIFSNNHIVLINKPAGFHCQPNESNIDASMNIKTTSSKCLVTICKKEGVGGGPDGTFLLPLHRIDQPCTGAVLLAKNSKAGARISKAWRQGKVSKMYYCVVEGLLNDMIERSCRLENDSFMLEGILSKQLKSRSVIVNRLPVGFDANSFESSKKGRYCQVNWSLLKSLKGNKRHLIKVTTSSGARHQVRAVLSQLANAPCAGDLRYGAKSPLDDKSVALHSREISMPTVTLGETNFSTPFVAPIPSTWALYFGLDEAELNLV